MPYCTKCGREIPLGANFCPNCGSSVSAPLVAKPVEIAKQRVTFRPIVWGLILTVIGGVFWVIFSIFAAFEQLAGKAGIFTVLVYIFGILFFFSIPVAIIIEIANWIKGRK